MLTFPFRARPRNSSARQSALWLEALSSSRCPRMRGATQGYGLEFTISFASSNGVPYTSSTERCRDFSRRATASRHQLSCRLVFLPAVRKFAPRWRSFSGGATPAFRWITFSARRELSYNGYPATPVDKGGGWMVVPRSSYDAEAYRQLTNEAFYEPINHDPDGQVLQRMKVLLSLLREKKLITRREALPLALQPPVAPSARQFYLLPKAHKDVWPFARMPPGRPIVSDVNSVTRTCASLIEHFLGPLARKNRSYVRDSLHVISSLHDTPVQDSFFLVTFDVSSLYTNIPTDDGIAACSSQGLFAISGSTPA